MDLKLIPLADLKENELQQLAVAHRANMHTLLSDLGIPIIQKYYQVARSDPRVIGVCIFSQSGELLGWGMGSPYPDAINNKLRKPLLWFVLQMVRLLFTSPTVIIQLISSILSISKAPVLGVSAVELTYIAVASSQRGQGLGGELIKAFIEASRKAGYHSIELSVETDNAPALALYKRMGFGIIQTFTEGRYQRHRMELKLDYEVAPTTN